MKFTIEAEIAAPPSNVRDAWVTPDNITCWTYASKNGAVEGQKLIL